MKTFGISHTRCARANRILRATQTGEPSHGCRTISVTKSPLTCGYLIPQTAIPLDYYVWSKVEQKTNKTPCNTKNELKARILVIFTNSDKETVQKSCWKFRCRLETVVEANCDCIEYLYSLVFQNICL